MGHDFEVRAASRHPERTASIFEPDKPGPHAVKADVHSEAEVAAALDGCYGVVNAVSLYVERSRDTFRDVHIDAAVRVARVARRKPGLSTWPISFGSVLMQNRLPATSRARGGRGEQAVGSGAFANTTLIRPSVISLARTMPFVTTLSEDGSAPSRLANVRQRIRRSYSRSMWRMSAEGVTRTLLSTPGLRRDVL